ncbi:MAG: VWA domain-containing protein [Acidobacteriota bacterium]|nr:VWA domain-containing protein [Acidobacteriota bacterium]
MFSSKVVAAAVLMAAAASPIQQAPSFRTGVQVVEVDARVFDRDGRFVTNLAQDDFEILEDGVAQQIVAISLIGSGRSAGSVGSGGSAGSVPVEGAERAEPSKALPSAKQTWIFFFDLNHLTPGAGFDRARKAVEEFVRLRFKEGDLAGVVAGDKMVNNRLTDVRADLVAAVRSVRPRGETRNRMIEMTREWPRFRDEDEAMQVARNIKEAVDRAVQRACSDDPDSCSMAESMVSQKAQRLASMLQKETAETFSAINGLASGLARVPGPKTIVFLSDGFATLGFEASLRTLVGQTARSGSRVYAIDARGLGRAHAGLGDAATFDDAAGGPARFDALEDGVNSLAVDTGGLMIRNENNIGRALDEIATDSGTYYVLGYQPVNTAFDGKYRKIEIRVKRPGLKVRARQGYLALEPSRMLVPERIR